MSSQRRNLSISLLTLVAVITVVLWSVARRRLAETAREEASARQRALSDREHHWERQLKAAKKSAAGTVATAELSPAAAVSAPKPPAARPGPLSTLLSAPTLQAEYFKARRANLPFNYGPLLAALGLSGDQTKQFEELMMRREEAFFDTIAAVPSALHAGSWYGGGSAFQRQNFLLSAVSDPLQATTPETRAAAGLLQQNEAEFRNAATALLGAEGFRQLLRYERVLPVRDTVDAVGATLVDAGTPLTVEQSKQLTQILADTIPGFADGARARPDKIDWAQAVARAAEFLSPLQIAALRAQGAYDQAGKYLQTAIEKVGGFAEKAGPR